MFKEIVLYIHRTAHEWCLARPYSVVIRGGCRAPVKNGVWANAIFFIAIFAPLYVCLLRDAIGMLRDYNGKGKGV